ncbi:type II secretion system protein E [Solidesulfovibrio fructosivorans JJ]]|uniref:Type II secretion system protein E n=1 Tax=Solidesulfovibrio fructosivorans JJ] TaxID=596151 RepID=E1K0Z6_SOLFR|nr:ATPase, T2SS/T4P/T4SS family [Solidesulfovibrio fructosivorans]EFL49692.1 type II secretion system protein E [Solidesulfovibrio fructosivorans JJ]]
MISFNCWPWRAKNVSGQDERTTWDEAGLPVPYLEDLLVEESGKDRHEVRGILESLSKGKSRESLGRLLVEQKYVNEDNFLNFFARLFGFEMLSSIEDDRLDFGHVEPFPIAYLKANLSVVLREEDGTLQAAVADPFNFNVLDDFRQLLGLPLAKPKLAPARVILSAINRSYGKAEGRLDAALWDMDENVGLQFEVPAEEGIGRDLLDETSSAPVIKLVNQIIFKAIKNNASDIHIEPGQADFKVRYRLDGVLHPIDNIPKNLQAPVLSRLKVMARLNIAEKRLPQDGRIEIRLGEQVVDIRISIFPTALGERAVLRLLDKNAKILRLTELGLSPESLEDLRASVSLSHGLILVTGPTGSGKTTSLYAALQHINTPNKNILTIEDPVEYQIEGIAQMQVNPKIDLTFFSGLRSMVRQDPDVILVGEIRDRETAGIAVQAAMTGHLVFSTLHTNDAATAITRLVDMGIEPFLLASACRVLVAQRLIRVLCPACKRPDVLSDQEIASLRLADRPAPQVFRAVGCEHCLGTGFKGRTAIYEMIKMTDGIQELIMETSDTRRIRQLAMTEGMIPGSVPKTV